MPGLGINDFPFLVIFYLWGYVHVINPTPLGVGLDGFSDMLLIIECVGMSR